MAPLSQRRQDIGKGSNNDRRDKKRLPLHSMIPVVFADDPNLQVWAEVLSFSRKGRHRLWLVDGYALALIEEGIGGGIPRMVYLKELTEQALFAQAK